MKRKLFLPIAAGVLSAITMAIADGKPPFVLPATTSAVVYRLHEDASGPDGARQRDQKIALTAQGDGYGAVVSSSGHADQSIPLALVDGALTTSERVAPDDQQSTVEAIGLLVALVRHPGPIVMGETWTTTATVQLPGGDPARVPLSVTANSVRGDDVTLAANGTGSGTIHGRGHSAKATIDLVLQASFHDGHVVSATTARKVTAHVPFRTITFSDMWTIAS